MEDGREPVIFTKVLLFLEIYYRTDRTSCILRTKAGWDRMQHSACSGNGGRIFSSAGGRADGSDMKRIQVALYDRNGYMPSLVDYLCKKGHSLFETRLFTSTKLLEKQAVEKGIDVLLAGEEVLEEIRCFRDLIPQIILLSEGDKVCEGTEYYVIFKYQPAQEIVREMLACVAEDDRISFTQRRVGGREMDVVSVYAPYGGAGVTEMATRVAKEMAQQKKTLFVSLELFQGLAWLGEEEKGGRGEEKDHRGMSEVIFYLKQRKGKLALKLETILVSSENLDGIMAVEDYRDLQSLESRDLQSFLDILIQQTDYACVVFDIGYLSEATLWLMEQSNRLYMPTAHTGAQNIKRQSFRRLLLREGREKLLEKFQL